MLQKILNFVNELPGIKVFSFDTLTEMRQRTPLLKGQQYLLWAMIWKVDPVRPT